MYIASSPSNPSQRARVLIVAREADTCLLLSGVLAREGFYNALVPEIKDMARVLQDEAPADAVVVDDASYSPQEVETLVRGMHAHPAWSRAPLLILSARDSEEQETAFLNMGADDCVAKPLKTKALVARIKRRIESV